QHSPKGPVGAVAGEHVEVVDVDVALAVGVPGLWAADLVVAVVSVLLAAGVQDELAQRVVLIGLGVHTPVVAVEVLGQRRDGIDRGALPGGLGGGCGLRGDGHGVSFWVGYRRTGVSAGRTADGEIRRGDLGGRSGWERSECGPGPAVEHSAAEA